MKLTINTKELKEALKLHKKIPSTVSSFILNGILIKTDNQYQDQLPIVELTTTNLEISIKTKLQVSDYEPGEAVVPLKYLENVVNTTATPTITLQLTDKNQLQVGKMKLNTLSVEEFPNLPTLINPQIADNLDFNAFKTALEKLSCCPSMDKSRTALCSYLINTQSNEIVATDSYKIGQHFFDMKTLTLTREEHHWENDESVTKIVTTHNLLIPEAIYTILKDIKNQDTFQIEALDNTIKFIIGDTIEIVSRLLSGTYPEYQKLLEFLPDKTIKFNPNEMIKALESFKKLMSHTIVKLTLNNDSIDITAEDREIGIFEDDIIANTITLQEQSLQMAFNVNFLIDILKNYKDISQIAMHYEEPLKAVIINEPDKEQILKYVLMPIRIS